MYFAGAMESIDIILPAFNPLPGWENIVIDRFLSLQQQLPENQLQLIIVNDGSDKLDEVKALEKLRSKITQLQWISYRINHGKGYALREGVRVSSAAYIIYTDIDWPYEEISMLGLIDVLLKNADVAIGIRDDQYYVHLPPARRRISRMLRQFNAKLLKLKVSDTQAGLKGFRKNVKNIFLKTTINRYLFDLEFIYRLSKKQEIKITGFPVSLRQGITFSKMNRKILLQEARNFLKIWLKG
ncbi:MAG: glycosyltransferase family 2 protein [Saprospiraceae bacterium]